jgi:hypothetical protein
MATVGNNHPKKRHAEGWKFGRLVVEHLSSRRSDPGRERVSQLVRAIREAQDEGTPIRHVRSLARVIQHALRWYAYRPTCALGESQGRGFLVFDTEHDGKGTASEHRAVNALIRLVELGLVGRLHRCHSNRCRKWLYGKKYCDGDCRKAHERSLRSFREYQRGKQSEYYQRKKDSAIKLRKEGKSIRVIADRLQTTPQRIEFWLRRAEPKNGSDIP